MRVDLHFPSALYTWRRFVFYDRVLTTESCAEDQIGEWQEWSENLDLHEMLLDGVPASGNLMGIIEIRQAVAWMLEYGIAARQPFLISVPPPVCRRYWTDCGYEYDVDYSYNVEDVEPLSPSIAAQRWERTLKWQELTEAWYVRNRELQRRRAAEILDLQWKSPKHMYIVYDVYLTRNQTSYAFPAGIVARLHSNLEFDGRRRFNVLAQGRSDKGRHYEAVTNLVTEASKHGVDENTIRSLPVKYQ